MVKVLTFGWEFPPHISGGLGTACHGLTKALLSQGTQILFVVPRSYGDEDIDLINASEFELSEESRSSASVLLSAEVGREKMRIIPLVSGIRPYTFTDELSGPAIGEWGYAGPHTEGEVQGLRFEGASKTKYEFSGSYGPLLLQEVARYAEIGGTIAGTNDFDLIHAHDWLTYPAGIAAKKISGKPLVIHIHATEYDRAREDALDSRILQIEKDGIREADRIVAVSQWTKEILVDRYGADAGKITVIHNAALPQKRLPFEKPARPGRNVVTFLGRITHQKGPEYFVAAARLVLKKLPDTHFIMGGAGDLLPAILNHVAALRLSSRFHYTGFLKGTQVDQIWSISDAYVMPSVSEPFGIAPLEAIQAGVPVIISNQSGVSEVIPDAIKVNFWDVEALASAICSVLKHKSLRATLKAESRKTIKKITWTRAAMSLNQLYHELHIITK